MFGAIPRRFARRAHTLGVLSVLLLAMALRGMVPPGVMPSVGADRQGDALFAFCLPTSSSRVPDALLAFWANVDRNSDPDPGTPAASCAFCVLGQLHMGLPESGDLSVTPIFFFAGPVRAPGNPALSPHGVRGPPLGSRAPPSFFIA